MEGGLRGYVLAGGERESGSQDHRNAGELLATDRHLPLPGKADRLLFTEPSMKIYLGNKVHPGTTGLHIQARPASWLAELGSVPILKPTEAMVPLVMALVQDRKGTGDPYDPPHDMGGYLLTIGD